MDMDYARIEAFPAAGVTFTALDLAQLL